MKQRIEWLAILRGMNILLVVMVHICLVDLSTGENHAFCTLVSWPFHAVRMPLFIFASGGLLYLSRIRKGVETRALYKDKFQRITIPFLRRPPCCRGEISLNRSYTSVASRRSRSGFWRC